jgi:hypothetical protein
MSETQAQQEIRRLVTRLARRIRVYRAIDGLVTGATVTAMLALLALVLFKTGWIDESIFWTVTAVGCTAPVGLAALGWFRRLDPVALAQRLDRAHDLHDRLSTALAIAEAGAKTPFEHAQLSDAARFVARVDVKPAAPFERPRDLLPLVVVAAAFGALVFLRPPSHEHPLPDPPPIQHDQVLDSATIELEKDRLEEIRRELEGLNDPEAVELVEEIEKLLEDVEERAISEKEFLDEIERLEEEYFDEEREKELDRLAQKLKEAAEKLEEEAEKDLEKEEDARELVDALKNKDLDRASKAMKKLADKLANKDLDEKQLERIARLMEKFSKNIDPSDPALQKLIEKNKDLIDKLQKKMNKNNSLSEKDKQRLKRAQKELEKQQKQQQKQEDSESSRELKKLRRLSQETSDRAKKKLEDRPGKGDKEKQGQKKDNYKNQAGRKAKEASENMRRKGEQQKRDEAREMARKQLRELREAMKRSGGRQGEGEQRGDSERGEKMRDFLRRAKGQKEGEKGRPGDAQARGKGSGKPGKQQMRETEGSAEKRGADTAQEATRETNFAGKGKGSRELGEETNLDSKRVDEKVDAEAGKGPSRSEIIRAASEEGFATTEYKDVYVDYESVVEEVMEKENVPAGYRYYIKRYFQLIKPQQE